VSVEDGLTHALSEAYAAARAAWPSLALDPARFEAALRQRLPESLPPADMPAAIGSLHVTDLYFALACAERDPVALSAFEQRFVPPLRNLLRRMGFADGTVDETLQVARVVLFVEGEHGPPRILEYGGRGQLRGWLRVVVSRLAFKASRPAREAPAGGSEWLDEGQVGDIELTFLRKTYGKAFKASFADAMAKLPVKDRVLLKQRFAMQTTVTALARQHRVNASTITRWVQDARERLIAATRDTMMKDLRIGRAEASSILRLVELEIDSSLVTSRESSDSGVPG
jgi:RNA polymerase sigma-70 factor, ECF subfamily